MALRSFAAGDNILVSYNKVTRNLWSAENFQLYRVIETIETEVREWVALTAAAAGGAVTAESGTASMVYVTSAVPGAAFQHEAIEDKRPVKSWRYRCTGENKTVVTVY